MEKHPIDICSLGSKPIDFSSPPPFLFLLNLVLLPFPLSLFVLLLLLLWAFWALTMLGKTVLLSYGPSTFCFLFWDGILLHCPGWPWTHSAAQENLELNNSSACINRPSSDPSFKDHINDVVCSQHGLCAQSVLVRFIKSLNTLPPFTQEGLSTMYPAKCLPGFICRCTGRPSRDWNWQALSISPQWATEEIKNKFCNSTEKGRFFDLRVHPLLLLSCSLFPLLL